jgi:hypothetical protein
VDELIENPLSDLMLSTHTCTPSCGCDGDFVVTADSIGPWLDEFGEEFGRIALRQVDDLLAKGPSLEPEVISFRNKRFKPPETSMTWLTRWRVAIEEALRQLALAEVLTVEDAEAVCEVARANLYRARCRLSEREQVVRGVARQNPEWCAAEERRNRAWKKRRTRREARRAKAEAELEASQQVMKPIEDALRAGDAGYQDAVRGIQAAELALFEAQRGVLRAKSAKPAVSRDGRPEGLAPR